MSRRILRRRVLMREYDYNKVTAKALASLKEFGHISLYDRAEFVPLNQEGLEKLQIMEILKGKHGPLVDPLLDLSKPAMLVHKLKDYLYDEGYLNWNVSKDEDGYICIQARSNTPKTRIGMAIFEKELESRI